MFSFSDCGCFNIKVFEYYLLVAGDFYWGFSLFVDGLLTRELV